MLLLTQPPEGRQLLSATCWALQLMRHVELCLRLSIN